MKKKILSLLTAFAMVFGIIAAPFTASAAEPAAEIPGQAETSTDDNAETESVTVHKILMTEEGLKAHNVDKKYQGGKLTDLESFFEVGARDIDGVYFAWAKKDTDGKYYWIKADGDFTTTKTEVDEAKLDEIPDDTLGGETESNAGKQFTTTGFKGEYKIFEIHSKSTYRGESYYDSEGNELIKKANGKYIKKADKANPDAAEIDEENVTKKPGNTLTDMKAVPVILTLPLRNEKGTIKAAHVYPKNTEEKPKIDKNFKNGNKLTEIEDPEKNLGAGAVYENYTKEKALASQELDKNVPYEIKTEIPAKAKYAQAYWDDVMTKGLTYNKDLMITINGEPAELNKDYTVTDSEHGFKAEFTDEGLKKLNNQEAAVTVMLTYSAKINKDAVIDIPESNNVRFFYGNNKGKGNTPIPTNPKNGELTVKKTWDNGSAWADGESATFKLVDANTGEDVTAKDLVNAPDSYKFEGTVTLKKGDTETYTWKYLNDEKQYKAVEISSTTLSDAEYSIDKDGNIAVTNHKSNNPQPLEPTTPKVVTYGKKFVKVNEEDERLEGAEFVIKKQGTEEYLAEKSAEAIQADQAKVAEAKTALDNAVKAYNALEADKQTETEKAKVTKAQEDLNAAVVKANEFYVWGAKKDAKKFTSNAQGQFEVTRLNKGTYTLVETKAPEKDGVKYADRADIDFEVGPGTYSSGDIVYDNTKEYKVNIENATDDTVITKDSDITGMTYAEALKLYDANEDNKLTVKEFMDGVNDALKVINRKVIIPQTGGIGSLIFIVAGLAIMGGAFVAYKKSQAVEA